MKLRRPILAELGVARHRKSIHPGKLTGLIELLRPRPATAALRTGSASTATSPRFFTTR